MVGEPTATPPVRRRIERIQVEMPPELRVRCEVESARRSINSLATWVRLVLTDHLDEQDKKQRE